GRCGWPVCWDSLPDCSASELRCAAFSGRDTRPEALFGESELRRDGDFQHPITSAREQFIHSRDFVKREVVRKQRPQIQSLSSDQTHQRIRHKFLASTRNEFEQTVTSCASTDTAKTVRKENTRNELLRCIRT